ncbi:MAG: NAD(+)/NADH kinase, partial [Winogradskyella sp.]
MKVAVYGQTYAKEATQKAFEILLEVLFNSKVETYIEEDFLNQQHSTLKNKTLVKSFKSLNDSYDLLISIGGDGTILRAITYVRDLGIPIVGINTGRLGFLATIQTDEIANALAQIFRGNYKISERSLLSVQTSPEH